jgi:predicted ArsR family transcriptional regulator
MKPLYARSLTDEEREVLYQSLKSSQGFTVRRAQMLLMSAEEQLKVNEIGRRVGCQGQAVRQAIHAFHEEGLSCLKPKAKGNPTDRRALDDGGARTTAGTHPTRTTGLGLCDQPVDTGFISASLF